MFPKYRGKQVLMRDENGLEKCVACGLCAVACPADAIYLEAAENDGTVQAGPRYASDLPDSQDALHFLRLLRRGLPGLGDLHGQGLRAGRLQQQGFHLGQGRPAGPCRDAAGRRRPRQRHVTAMLGFLDALDERVLVCDGAMGTMLYARGIFLNRCFDELNLTQPDLVAEIHRDYVRAGADVIETNTFGANRFKLAKFGLADKVRIINIQGARHRTACGARDRLGRRVDRPARRFASSPGVEPASTKRRPRSASRPRRSSKAASISSSSRPSAT